MTPEPIDRDSEQDVNRRDAQPACVYVQQPGSPRQRDHQRVLASVDALIAGRDERL